jgi:cytochrome b subunit of formate dehydrogenase
MINQRLVKGTIHWLLTVVAIVYLITGFGITEYRIVETLTFGLLTKSLAQQIHINLEIPFIALLVLHIWVLPLLKHFRLKGVRSTSSDKQGTELGHQQGT